MSVSAKMISMYEHSGYRLSMELLGSGFWLCDGFCYGLDGRRWKVGLGDGAEPLVLL